MVKKVPKEYQRLTHREANKLNRLLKKARLTPKKLLSGDYEIPNGLTPKVLSLILNTSYAITVKVEYVNFLYTIATEEANKLGLEQREYQTITDLPETKRKFLIAEKERTGILFSKIIDHVEGDGLSLNSLSKIENGQNNKADLTKLDRVLEAYSKFPDLTIKEKKEFKMKIKDKEPISSEDMAKLRKMNSLGLLPTILFRHKTPPFHITPAMISYWLGKENPSTNPEAVKWVLKACKEVLEEGLEAFQ